MSAAGPPQGAHSPPGGQDVREATDMGANPDAARGQDVREATEVGVRNLCEFVAKTGDLSQRFTPVPTAEQGRMGHAVVAQRRGAGYDTEVSLSARHAGLVVRGRADGFDSRRGVLEEIKTFKGSLENIGPNQRELHWAQLKMYGWMMCQTRGLAHIDLALVYFNVIDQTEHADVQGFDANRLREFFESACTHFAQWAQQEQGHRLARDAALDDLDFPQLPFRPGQRDMAASVYRACVQSRPLLVQAPTGIGKSLGTLFPALRAMPVRGSDKIFYLTAKTSGRQVALDALDRVCGSGKTPVFPLRVLEMVAREKSCEHPTAHCNGASCPLARGFYDRLPQARQAATNAAWLDQAALRQIAREHHVCPYYLSQEMLRWCDVVVGDYNYYFDRNAVLFSLTEQSNWRVTLLIDEAHNLCARACGMYSAELSLHEALSERPRLPASLRPRLDAWVAQWRSLLGAQTAAQAGAQASRWLEEIPAAWSKALTRLIAGMGEHLEGDASASPPTWLDFYFRTQNFASLAEALGEHSLCELDVCAVPERMPEAMDFGDTGGGAAGMICLHNIVPAPFLVPRWAKADSSVLFSATLNPQTYYVDMLGLSAQVVRQDIPTPFPPEHLRVRVLPVSTRREDRERTLPALVHTMASQFAQEPGNYLAFFSSFEYLELAWSALRTRHPTLPTWAQERDMSETRRTAFLQRFQADGQGIGFAVLGGAFAEGVDLPGRRLIGAFVATLGLPQFDALSAATSARLEQQFGRGYDYTYLFPGLQKVVQAAGRVIRSEHDQGTLWLLDQRYTEQRYRQWLPPWWQTRTVPVVALAQIQ